MKKILLQGYYGVNNLGDDYILLSLMSMFSEMSDVTVTCITAGDRYNDFVEYFDNKLKFEFVDEKRKSNLIIQIRDTLNLLKRHDIWLIGGGGLYTTERFLTFLKLYLLISFATLKKNKVAFYGIEINSISKKSSKILWRKILNKVDFVYARNNATVNLLRELNSKNKRIANYGDLTFSLETESEKKGRMKEEFDFLKDSYIIWGLAMPWKEEELVLEKYANRYNFFIDQIASLCNKYDNFTHVFLPFFERTDSKLINDVIAKLKVKYYVCTDVPRCEKRFLFKGARFAVCMRFHSVLFSMYNEIPFAAISYAPKTSRILDECHLSDNYVEFGIRDTQFFYKEFDLDDTMLKQIIDRQLTSKKKYNYNEIKAHAEVGRNLVMEWIEKQED